MRSSSLKNDLVSSSVVLIRSNLSDVVSIVVVDVVGRVVVVLLVVVVGGGYGVVVGVGTHSGL